MAGVLASLFLTTYQGPGVIYPLPPDSSPLNDSMSMPEDSMSMLELDQATEVVWGAILGKEGADVVVARILDGVPVILSGPLCI